MKVAMLRFTDHITGLPLVTFLDPECTIPHTNPIVLPADGGVPPIFLDGGNWAEKVYDLEALDAYGRPIWELKPLTGTMRMRSFWWRVLFGEEI